MSVYVSISVFKKILFIIFFVLLAAPSPALASAPVRYYDWSTTTGTSSRVLGEATPSATATNLRRFNRYLTGGGLLPDSPLYFIKGFQEGVQFALTLDAKTKEKMRLEVAGERLEEIQIMADKAKAEAVRTAARKYQQTMEDAAKNLKDDSLEEAETEIAKHQVVLGEVAAKVPDAGKDAVKKALQAAEKSTDVLADLAGRPAVPPDVVDRITALKAQGLLTPEEASKLISLKTRVEAREELRKYANEGILPTADLLRMNERMKTVFPQDFYRLHEIERFQEMKKLETEKFDPETKERVQEFAKNYKPGGIVPADIRPYWASLVRLEEVQNTFRPDLIDPNLFKNNPEEEKKFKEIVERYKPRKEDMEFVQKYMDRGKVSADQLPPEYQRMYNLAQSYGVSVGAPPPMRPSGEKISCPFNSHWVNGVCVPNYTPRGESAYCPNGYHRNYENGPCLPDNNTGTYLPPLTTTPGNYPNPYTQSGRCSFNQHWVPEPINPNGGYCAQNDTSAPPSGPSRESQEAACRAGGGVCVSWVNGACGCERNAGTATSCRPPASGCPANKWWDQGACVCRESGSYPSSCAYPTGGCGAGNYWDSAACQCRSSSSFSSGSSGSSMSRESQEATCRAGGGSCTSWVNGACSCQGYQSGAMPNTPPSGYGSCPSGQYWNGLSCTSSAPSPSSSISPEENCRRGGCQWQDNTCRCGTQTPQPSPPPSSPPPSSSPPSSTPEPGPGAAYPPTP